MGVILESAAEINDGGKYELDWAELAYFLHTDLGDIEAVADALESIGRTAGGVVRSGAHVSFSLTDRPNGRRVIVGVSKGG